MRHRDATDSISDGTNAQLQASRNEEIHVRNFDVRRSYDLTVQIRTASEVVFLTRYSLTPGKTATELGRVSPGEYEVYAELGGRRSERVRCEIDETPEGTARIEVGNGTLSVSQGLYP
jgi:hypothetical protein